MNETNESSVESNENIHHIKEIRKIEETKTLHSNSHVKLSEKRIHI